MRSAFQIFLSLVLLVVAVEAATEPLMGRVVGRVVCRPGECKGVAALWPAERDRVPAPEKYLLIPAVATVLGEDGSFELNAPPGEYFVGAQLRRTPGALLGAPRVGDQIYLIGERDKQGHRVTVAAAQTTDIGSQSTFWTYAGMVESPTMGVSGQVIDLEQKPVAGLLVFAFADPGATTTPLAVSQRTGEDGRFVLPLIEPGPVFLRARKNYRGGQPEAEDYVGVASGLNQTIIVEMGRMIHDLKVMVRKLPRVLGGKNAPDGRPKVDATSDQGR